MSNPLSSTIKTRCTENFKKEVDTYAKAHNTTTSSIVLSAVEAAIHSESSSNRNDEFSISYKCNVMKNTILNRLSLDPTIPATTINKIRKELNNHDLCKFNY